MNLLLTLGHNSSAILVSDDGEVLCGYENERLSRIKSDSSFPLDAIEEIENHYTIPKDVNIYISHWFTNGRLPDIPNKWWNPTYLHHKYPDAKVVSLDKDFTHHDAHMHSVIAFRGGFKKNHTIIVADGFGNFGETISIYKENRGEMKLFKRAYGYSSSVGLLYQYATAYLDLKMNQDEYKLLGYEAEIYSLILGEKHLQLLEKQAEKQAEKMIDDILSSDVIDEYDPILSIDALPALRENYRVFFDNLLKEIGINSSNNLRDKRIVIAHFVQQVVENLFSILIDLYVEDDVMLAGGVFMNVKLNNMIANQIPGTTCIMPLAGDQGAAIGIYHAKNKNFIWPDTLSWGLRDLSSIHTNVSIQPGLLHVPNNDNIYKIIAAMLDSNMIVNLVQGHMEFGARALGNTSTLALPTKTNVNYINSCNRRSTIMPMAGVCTMETAKKLHGHSVYKIEKSLSYMICTRDFIKGKERSYEGACHYNPRNFTYTGRTQVVDENNILHTILSHSKHDLLINTSFNPHGKPILFDMDDIISGHNYMVNNDIDNRVITVILY